MKTHYPTSHHKRKYHITVHSRGTLSGGQVSSLSLPCTLLPCAAVKRTPPTERTIQSMTINNPPDQPSVEQITTKNNISYTSHDHHPLTGTPFPENNTAIPATPTTLTTLATLATGDHSDSNFPLRLTTLEHTTLPSIVTLRATKGLSRWAERCFAALSMTALPLTTALWQSSPTGVTSPFTLP